MSENTMFQFMTLWQDSKQREAERIQERMEQREREERRLEEQREREERRLEEQRELRREELRLQREYEDRKREEAMEQAAQQEERMTRLLESIAVNYPARAEMSVHQNQKSVHSMRKQMMSNPL